MAETKSEIARRAFIRLYGEEGEKFPEEMWLHLWGAWLNAWTEQQGEIDRLKAQKPIREGEQGTHHSFACPECGRLGRVKCTGVGDQ